MKANIVATVREFRLGLSRRSKETVRVTAGLVTAVNPDLFVCDVSLILWPRRLTIEIEEVIKEVIFFTIDKNKLAIWASDFNLLSNVNILRSDFEIEFLRQEQ